MSRVHSSSSDPESGVRALRDTSDSPVEHSPVEQSPVGRGPEANSGNRLCQPVVPSRRQCIPLPSARTVSAAVARSLRIDKKPRRGEMVVRPKEPHKRERVPEAELPWTNYRRRCDGWSAAASDLQARGPTTWPAIRGPQSSQTADLHQLPRAGVPLFPAQPRIRCSDPQPAIAEIAVAVQSG